MSQTSVDILLLAFESCKTIYPEMHVPQSSDIDVTD
jgi:hypothetical protein